MADVITKDLVIVGGGPAGLSAAIYAKRALLDTVVLEKQAVGGQVITTTEVENYPGMPNTDGFTITDTLQKQATDLGAEIVMANVLSIVKNPETNLFVLETSEGTYHAKAVIVSGGANPRHAGFINEEKFTGKGVSYCATCDGAFFEECEIVVIGGGDSAVEEAMYLTKFADKVTIVHRRDELRAAKSIQEKAFANPKMAFKWNAVVEEVCGEGLVDSVILKDTKTGETSKFETEGVFVFIGHNPQTAFIQGLVNLDENGYILTNGKMETNVPGIYGVGDVIQKESRQVVTAAADGALAGIWAGHYIDDIKAKMAMKK